MLRSAVIREENGKWCVRSPDNPDWSGGCYDTKEEAEERLRQVEYFKRQAMAERVAIRHLAKLNPYQRAWERRKEKDERAQFNIPPEYHGLWNKLKTKFKGTPDQRAEQFMEYVEEHPDENVEWLQEHADREVSRMTREWEREQRELQRQERECDKRQDKYEQAWYREQERATKEKRKLKQLQEQAESVCQDCPTCPEYEAVPFAASMAERIAARYKRKHKVKTEDGGEDVVYEYSDRQVAYRNNQKAKRIKKLEKAIDRLRSKVVEDLDSDDPAVAKTALIVGLIDHTFERVGNPGSAKDGHFGVSEWRKKHVSFGGSKATIKYVGKSGVEQHKTVDDGKLVKALKAAYEAAEGDELFPDVQADQVNAYLREFDVTAKDLRGFHANREMRERLKSVRRGKLPQDKAEREKRLKAEFGEALEQTAKAVGHEPSTLRSQYLVPGLEDEFLATGKIKTAAVRCPSCGSTLVDVDDSGDAECERCGFEFEVDADESKAPLVPILADGWRGRGNTYWMPLEKDQFVHFTTLSRAKQIMDAGKLLMKPPYQKFGPDEVFAISTVYGEFLPGVQTTHTKTQGTDSMVAVVFTTRTPPVAGHAEEVFWRRDVTFQKARMVPFSAGRGLLQKAPVRIGEMDTVLYDKKHRPAGGNR